MKLFRSAGKCFDVALKMEMQSIWRQIRALWRILLIVYIPTLAMLGIFVVVSWQTDIKFADFSRDPVAVMGAPAYTGLLSNIGILFWCSSAAIYLFSFAVSILHRGTASISNRELQLFLLVSGFISFYVLLDDFFMFHENLSDYISEVVILTAFGTIILLYLVRFRATILGTEYLLLALAFAFIGLSLAVDFLHDIGWIHEWDFVQRGQHVIEDGFKLLGAASWLAYCTVVCLKQTSQVIAAGRRR